MPEQIKDAADINVIVVADTDLIDDRFWVNVQNLLGQRVAIPTADNGAMVQNFVENMMGSNDLISLRTRERSDASVRPGGQYPPPGRRASSSPRNARCRIA